VPLSWSWLSWSQVADHFDDASKEVIRHSDLGHRLFVRYWTIFMSFQLIDLNE